MKIPTFESKERFIWDYIDERFETEIKKEYGF